MKQQFQALGMTVVFLLIGTVFLFLTRGAEYLYKFVGMFGKDVFMATGMVFVSAVCVIAFQQAILHLVVRRMAVDK